MNLNNIQLCRCAAFIAGIHLINESVGSERELSTEAIKALQNFTVERANSHAEAFSVSFPDETERETAQSIAAWEAKMESEIK